jgi:hypothetical protein
VKRAGTAFVIVASMLAVALLAPGASAKFTTHNSNDVTQTAVVQGSEDNTCADRIVGDAGWAATPQQLVDPPNNGVIPTGPTKYEVFLYAAGENVADYQYRFDPILGYGTMRVYGTSGPPLFTETVVKADRVVLGTPIDIGGGKFVYSSVPFVEAISPAAPLGSTLGIKPIGGASVRPLTVVDCPPPLPVYTFTGFSAPVDNGMVNIAKAGSAIPLKFRVTDANGAPVTGLTAPPVAVTSKGAPCGTAPGDAIEEYAPGNSGLQDLGNGYYQFNWKTPKSYKGHCRTVMVSLGDGVETHTAQFSFR